MRLVFILWPYVYNGIKNAALKQKKTSYFLFPLLYVQMVSDSRG